MKQKTFLNEEKKSTNKLSKIGGVIFLLIASIFTITLGSASLFGYNFQTSGGTSTGTGNNITNYYNVTNVTFVDGTATCPSGYVVQNITANGTGIYSQCISQATATVNVNSTQFDDADPIHIDETWLTSFIEAVGKWANYWTKTENINQAGYNITADYFFGNGSQLTGITATEADTLDSVTTRGATTTNVINVGGINDSADTLSIDPNNRKLYGADSLTVALDWETRELVDNYGVWLIRWDESLMFRTSIHEQGTGHKSIDPNSRKLYKSDGTTISFDWNNLSFPTLTTDGILKVNNSNGTIIVDTTEYYPLSNPYNYTNSSSAEADPKWTGNSTQVSYLASNNTFTGEVNTFKGINTTSLGTFNCWGSGLTICKNDTGVFFS